MGNLQSTPSSSTTTTSQKNYDVFLNFRGEDTRRCFTCHLHKALQEKIETFIDDGAPKGKHIWPTLKAAIEQSKISVVIFTKDYASSKWCLRELVEIMERENKHIQIVIPVFYGVEPTDVRYQTGSFEYSFDKHGNESQGEMQKWRKALTEASNLFGFYSSKFKDDSTLIDQIVDYIWMKLKSEYPPHDIEGLIGHKRIKRVISSLCLDDRTNVQIIGIWGMGGIGKTYIAEAIFKKISNQFVGECFIENVRERLQNSAGLVSLQEEILSKVFKEENLKLNGPIIPSKIEDRLNRTPVLIVLDNVDNVNDVNNVEKLARSVDRLGLGSRVIITSRDKHVLRLCGVNDQKIFEVKGFNDHDALQLFYNHAFRENYPLEDRMILSNELINYSKGNPLALKVLGSSLYQSSKQEWESVVNTLRTKNLNRGIFDVLKISYDGLEDSEKNTFLDIVCFFKGEERGYVEKIIGNCSMELGVLIKKSLITISYGYIQMHDLLEEMGREIVDKESPNKPGKRSRLWRQGEVQNILKYDEGTSAIQGIVLDLSNIKDMQLSSQAFKKMYNLRFLKFDVSGYYDGPYNSKVHIPNGLSDLSDKLRSLIWFGFPLTALPSNFSPENLVELRLTDSNLERLWEGTMRTPNLKWLDLYGCERLTNIPDLSDAPLLEEIDLDRCQSLLDFPKVAQHLKYLHYLGLQGCESLRSFPSDIHFESLTSLKLCDCDNLTKFPEISGDLRHLDLSGTAIDEVPTSIGTLTKLSDLNLSNCMRLKHISTNICKLKSLLKLNLANCSGLESFPEISGDLRRLDLHGTAIDEVPPSIGSLTNLVNLNLSQCMRLKHISTNICKLKSLQWLNLENCSGLERFPEISGDLRGLDLSGTAIDEVPPLIGSLTNLSNLTLSRCTRLEHISNSLCKLKSLQELNLENCSELGIFPEIWETMEGLQFLELSGTEIKELPGSIENLNGLNELWLRGCENLEELPSSICNLTSLEGLDLSNCSNLVILPDNLGNLKSLNELSIDRTAISQLPSTMMQLNKLESLSCCGCRGLRFTHSSDFPCSLRKLYLSDCNLKKIPEDICHLSLLEEVDLSRNKFESLPKSMKQLSILKNLNVNNCNMLQSLTELPLSIEFLSASDCKQLRSIPDASELVEAIFIFTNCPNLEETAVGNILATVEGYEGELYSFSFCCPGSEVPGWFSYKSDESLIKFRMARHDCFNGLLPGFIVCAVIEFEVEFEEYCFDANDNDDDEDEDEDEEYCFDANDNDEDEDEDEDELYVMCRWTFSDESYPLTGLSSCTLIDESRIETSIDSDHMAMWYCKSPYHRFLTSEFTNCSFEFWLTKESPNCRVKSCGVRPITKIPNEDDKVKCAESIKIFGVTIEDIGETSGKRSRTSNDHLEEEVELHSKRLNLDLSL